MNEANPFDVDAQFIAAIKHDFAFLFTTRRRRISRPALKASDSKSQRLKQSPALAVSGKKNQPGHSRPGQPKGP